ncbi:MAG: Holliday junction resolvase RuvX [Proteobacteria bacterium]|mgnify:FL=1|jgi:putative holliday junction resolvase|nr:Holliday junction resolvase RuvX [Pseudomonadota bacterium]
MKKKRVIGLDVGTKGIGVAISDELGMCAYPTTTLTRQGVRKDVQKIEHLIKERSIGEIVVGLPLELDGREARSARLARQIGNGLAEATGLPVLYVDERYTSVEAERQLISANVSRQRRKAVIDQQAAVLILQAYLDHGATITEK